MGIYDKACLTYWCDHCHAEMIIDYVNSESNVIILKCQKGCGTLEVFRKEKVDKDNGKG